MNIMNINKAVVLAESFLLNNREIICSLIQVMLCRFANSKIKEILCIILFLETRSVYLYIIT